MKHKADQISLKSKVLLTYTLLTSAAALLSAHADAQTIAEWFSQKKTQKKYILEQIAALHMYSSYVKQGYNIAHNGLATITGALGQEFELHNEYYSKRSAVNPVVKNSPQVNQIMTWQNEMLGKFARIAQNGELTLEQKVYFQKVKKALLADCEHQLSLLHELLKDGKLQMNDEERISRLDQIYTAMQDNYRFTSSFIGQLQRYSLQHQQAFRDDQAIRAIYGDHH
ncbi:hypothetical protein [Mucilaginibacter sp. CSA2-8R]|uniref:hypothetical protein n=1 Tax=Mucilaginibacter sp. CSA2-8R TaxID=3141542 RepID=UPI00315DE0AB